MTINAPMIRTDREFLNEVELRVAEIALNQIAEAINHLAAKGAIYGQLVLPPEEAQLKRQAMGGQ